MYLHTIIENSRFLRLGIDASNLKIISMPDEKLFQMGKQSLINKTKVKKKKILVFIDWFLPGYRAGGPIQSCANLIEHLKDDFEFLVVTRNKDIGDSVPYDKIISNEWIIHPSGARVFYFSDTFLSFKNIKRILLTEEYDVVYLNSLFSLYFTIFPLIVLKLYRRLQQVVLATRGVLGEGALSIRPVKKYLFIYLSRIVGLFSKIGWHATSDLERKEIKKFFGASAKITVATNLPKKEVISYAERKKEPNSLSLVFLSRISKKKNLSAVLDYLLNISGSIILHVYGPIEDAQYWKYCLEKARELPENIKFSYQGIVNPQQINSIFKQYHFMILPTLHENYGHVIFESLSVGCPVIISDTTPWLGLEEKKAGWDISLADKGQFIAIISKCVQMGQEEYDELSRSAFEYAERIVNDKDSMEQSRNLFL